MTVQFDPQSPDFVRNPYPVYDRLRANQPIFFHEPTQLWLVTGYEDVTTLLRDRRYGRSIDHVLPPEQRSQPAPPPEHAPFTKLNEHSLFDKEPPDHTRLKRLVQKAFTPRRVRRLAPRIETIAHELLDQVAPQQQMDLLADFAVPLPVTVIAELLGVPAADRPKLRPWSQAIVAMYELDHTPQQAARAIQASREFADYLRALARRRRHDPQDDLISALALVEDEGSRLSEDELIATCVLLLNAGHEATVNVIGNGMWALLQHPSALRALQNSPALIPDAIEEMMRYDTPLQLFKRWVLTDVTYKGHTFRQGEQLGLIFGAANRDPTRFPHPHAFDIYRRDDGHVSFGGGIHYCLGAPLARLELSIAFRVLLQRLPRLQPVTPPTYTDGYVIRGLQALHLLI